MIEEILRNTFRAMHKATEPPVSIIMPYNLERMPYPIFMCKNDEGIIVLGGKSIGDARIAGAKKAKNEWLIFVDSDAIYPPNYILEVKEYIRKQGDKTPIMATKRLGGLFSNPPAHRLFAYEHGLIVRKDVFFERIKEYPKDAKGRADIGFYFKDAVPIPVKYYHGLTYGEKILLLTTFSLGVPLFISMLQKRLSK